MKRLILSLSAVLLSSCALAWKNGNFKRSAADFVKEITIGINVGNTLDVPKGDEVEWGNAKITPALFKLYRQKGFSAVRIPISWRKQFDRNDPTHTVKPEFMARVKEVVDMCLKEDMVAIVNIHHDGGDDGWPGAWLTIDGVHEDAANGILADLWKQIATTFKDYDERVVFEGFNEVRKAKQYAGPSGKQKGQEDWAGQPAYFAPIARYADTFYKTVRATGGKNAKRYLMIPTYASAFQESTVKNWHNPNPQDNHIIATIHCYEPGDFCIWGNRKAYDAAYIQKKLDLYFGFFKKYLTDAGIPLILGEINADLRYYDQERFLPNDDARIRWAAHYAREARKYGFPCFIWESGGKKGMGLIDRFKNVYSHEEVVDAFIAGARGTDTEEKLAAWCAKVKVDPKKLWEKGDALLKWKIDGEHYNGWGQTMGYGNLNGNGKVKQYLSSDDNGNLIVNSQGKGGNMIQQQFWADQSVTAIRTYKAYVKTHEDLSLKGKKLVFSVKAAPGTSVNFKGTLVVPGLKERLKFGADSGPDQVLSENGSVARVEIALPEGAKLDPKGKGIGAEVWFIPKTWGANLPLNCVVSPIEIK